jgi:hypothetical protein
MKKIIRLTENDLVRLVKRVMNEQLMNYAQKKETFVKEHNPPIEITFYLKNQQKDETFEDVPYAIASITKEIYNYTTKEVTIEVDDESEYSDNSKGNQTYRTDKYKLIYKCGNDYIDFFAKNGSIQQKLYSKYYIPKLNKDYCNSGPRVKNTELANVPPPHPTNFSQADRDFFNKNSMYP